MAANEDRCIICGQEKPGIEIKEDYMVSLIRWFKRNVTKNEKGYHLVVCRECYVKYKKQYDSYVRKEIAYVTIGVVFAALMIVMGSANLVSAVAFGIAIIVFMYLLAQLSYMPALKLPTRQVGGEAAARTAKKAPKRSPKNR
ncbi:MAG: hypothetical protein ACP5RM_00685 [Candidatus Micrarchaeia archaeon]